MDLEEQDKELDKYYELLEKKRDSLKRESAYARFAYATFEDLEILNQNNPKLLGEASDSNSDNE